MADVIYSVACRAGHHGGWYGRPGERCPKCNRVVFVTGAITVIDLKDSA